MQPFLKHIRSFIICLATIASGLSFSGYATTVPANTIVLTEVVITSPQTEELLATYLYFQKSGVQKSVEFTQHSFFILLKNFNCLTSVSFEIHQKLSQNLKLQLLQQVLIHISPTRAGLSEDIS